ncbi:beta-2 adrenergic receptor-like [Liolophura sinensis]|uniref:beta-2 adrenergic receptor-like n=1 Tax=Liolophura sinensis TaxID=3198878 RepID=UPI0031586CD3
MNFSNITNVNDGFLGNSDLYGGLNNSVLGNFTQTTEPCEDVWCVIQTICIVIITVLIILTNLMDIAVIYLSFDTFDAPEYFMLSLAFADLGVGILVTPFSILPSYYQRWLYGLEWCSVTATVAAILCSVSIYSLMLISVDRYLNIMYPLHSLRLITKSRCMAAIAVTWILSLVVHVVNKIVVNKYYFDDRSYICSIDFPNQPTFTITLTATVVAPPMVIICFVYVRIFCIATRHRAKLNELRQLSSQAPQASATVSMRLTSAWKSVKMYVFIIGGFCFAWIPYSLLNLVLCTTDLQVPKLLGFIILWNAMANSFWNTIIYFLMHKKYREGCNKILEYVTSRHRITDHR